MPHKKLLFGTAGVPISTKGSTSISGIERIKELGLDCMELAFVQGVRISETGAKNVFGAAKKQNVILSVHAPYYINLNSYDEEKQKASIDRIYQAAKIGSLCGAESIVFHAAFYQKCRTKKSMIRCQKLCKNLPDC